MNHGILTLRPPFAGTHRARAVTAGYLATVVFALLSTISLTAGTVVAGGVPLLAGQADVLYYGQGDGAAIVTKVSTQGQSFKEAFHVDTYRRADTKGDFGLTARLNAPIKKGDVLWVSLQARRLDSQRESGEAFFELRLDQLVNGKYVWPPFLERGVSVGPEWTEISIPFAMERDVSPEQIRLVLKFDSYPQRFELSPITLLNYGQGVKPESLPRSVVRYEGSEPDAPWRKEAAARIERIRKGDLEIKVVDRQGRAVADAAVSVRMKRIAFNFGAAISSQLILDEKNPDAAAYRDALKKYFNQVVFDNEMKWPAWAKPDHDPAPTLRALDWLDQNGLTARGHVMVWPAFRRLPASIGELKNDPTALSAAVFKHIEHQTRVMQGRFVEWDVTNEISANHDLVDILGRDEIVRWYQAARAGEPGVKLFYNEYTMFHAEGPGSGNEHFFETVKFLKARSAPIDGIGEQAHIGGTPPPIPLVLARLDKFSTLGLPITITEFDINSNDDDFKANYLRDFLTAIFSHPNTTGFVQWGFWAGHHWFPVAALWNKDWTLRKHGQVYTELVGKTWRTDTTGHTAADGTYRTRAFYGDYEIAVFHNGKSTTTTLKLQPGATRQSVILP